MQKGARHQCMVLALALTLAAGSSAAFADPFGKAPTYTTRSLSAVPNAAAITKRIWAPGLDEGYVPQGVTHSGGALYVSSYQSTDPKQNTGRCRLYRLDPEAGSVTGQLDLPVTCGHAGGLAKGATPATLFVADTRHVFEVAVATPSVPSIGRVARVIALAGDVKGAFAASDQSGLWLGTFARTPDAKLYHFPYAKLKPRLTEADASAVLPLPAEAQGGAFDRQGRLWISRSVSKYGELAELDVKTGQVKQRFAMSAGLEDLSFDETGAMWTLSEAGSQRWNTWPTFYPIVMRLDPARLR